MTDHYADAATRYAGGLAETLAALEAHRQACARATQLNWIRPSPPAPPALPLVVPTDEDRAEMARVDVRSLRIPAMRDDADAGIASWDELFVAWRVHSRLHFGCAWKKVDGSALMYSHVASAVHIMRTHVLRIQDASTAIRLAA